MRTNKDRVKIYNLVESICLVTGLVEIVHVVHDGDELIVRVFIEWLVVVDFRHDDDLKYCRNSGLVTAN